MLENGLLETIASLAVYAAIGGLVLRYTVFKKPTFKQYNPYKGL